MWAIICPEMKTEMKKDRQNWWDEDRRSQCCILKPADKPAASAAGWFFTMLLSFDLSLNYLYLNITHIISHCSQAAHLSQLSSPLFGKCVFVPVSALRQQNSGAKLLFFNSGEYIVVRNTSWTVLDYWVTYDKLIKPACVCLTLLKKENSIIQVLC